MKLFRHNVLRITDCSDPQLWYAGLIGAHVPHEGFAPGDGYRSREKSGHVNFVRLSDAKPTVALVTEHSNGRWPFLKAECQTALADSYAGPTAVKRAVKPKGQSRTHSAVEALLNIAAGFVVSLGITAVVLPAYGHQVTLAQNIEITSIFTVASLLRSYVLRRLFNRLQPI